MNLNMLMYHCLEIFKSSYCLTLSSRSEITWMIRILALILLVLYVFDSNTNCFLGNRMWIYAEIIATETSVIYRIMCNSYIWYHDIFFSRYLFILRSTSRMGQVKESGKENSPPQMIMDGEEMVLNGHAAAEEMVICMHINVFHVFVCFLASQL